MCSLHFPSNESILNYFLSCSSLSELQFPISDCPSQDELFQKASVTEWLRLEGTSGDCLVHHPAQAGSRGAGCPGPCPSGFSISPMKEMPQPLWATWCSTSQNGLAISAEEAKRNVVGFFPICKILDSFSFDYLSSPTPWNRTCNLANKDLMTRINPAVSVKILSESENQVRRACLSLSVLHEKNHSIWKKKWFHSDSWIYQHLKTFEGKRKHTTYTYISPYP